MFSCIEPIGEPEERTPSLEAFELNQVLANIEADGYDLDTTDLGIYYIVHKEGEGNFPEPGDTCRLEYSGFFLDGVIFDASAFHYADSTWEFVYKEIDLISGFDDGIALMNKGAEIDMIIPSGLAYGEYGSGNIPPYSPIMFSAKMRDIKPPVEN
jgi:FKBP-type peptidyl-prolyl cis-trans isomerase FkpA